MYLIERVHIRFGKKEKKKHVFCLMDTATLCLEINQQGPESLHISPTSDQLQIASRLAYLHWPTCLHGVQRDNFTLTYSFHIFSSSVSLFAVTIWFIQETRAYNYTSSGIQTHGMQQRLQTAGSLHEVVMSWGFHPFFRPRRPLGWLQVYLYPLLGPSALNGGGGSAPRPGRLYPRERTSWGTSI